MSVDSSDRSFDVDLTAAPPPVRHRDQWITDLKYRLPVRYLAAWAALALLILVSVVVAPASMRRRCHT